MWYLRTLIVWGSGWSCGDQVFLCPAPTPHPPTPHPIPTPPNPTTPTPPPQPHPNPHPNPNHNPNHNPIHPTPPTPQPHPTPPTSFSYCSNKVNFDVVIWKYFPKYCPFVRSVVLPLQRARHVELWCFLCCQPAIVVEKTVGLPMMWDAMTQIAKFMGPTWGPPGSYRPQMGPMLAPWTLLSGDVHESPCACDPYLDAGSCCIWQVDRPVNQQGHYSTISRLIHGTWHLILCRDLVRF